MTGARGDIEDVKRSIALQLSGPKFIAAMATVILGKQDSFSPLPPARVYQEERLTTIYYPAGQVIGLRTLYPNAAFETVKHAVHEIAVMWTAVAKDEFTVTRYVEILVRATVEMLWGVTLDMAVQNGPVIVTEEDYCVAPETRLLKSDLTWVRADAIRRGDELIGFDEGLGKYAKYKPSTVLASKNITRPRIHVRTTHGDIIVATEHPFVVRCQPRGVDKRLVNRSWMKAHELRPGMRLAFLARPWDVRTDYDAGYLGGFFDGEGWVSNTHVGFGQNPGNTLTKVIQLLSQSGFHFKDKNTQVRTAQFVTQPMRDGLHFLGSIRPPRLFAKSRQVWENRMTHGKNMLDVQVISVDLLDVGEVVAIETSTRTYVSEGFLSHNSPLIPTRDHPYLKSGRVMLTVPTWRGE